MNYQEYEEKSKNEAIEAAKPLADAISKFVNNSCDGRRRAEALGFLMASDHPTLVQTKMHLVINFLKEMSNRYQRNQYDLRSEATCKMSNEMLNNIDDFIIPYV